MPRIINIGFIGVGFVAQQCHLPCFSAISNVRIVAIADPLQDLATNVANRFSVPKVFGSHLDLIALTEIDAVIITLPRHLTAGVVRDALLASKNVFTEKPLALNSETGAELAQLAIAKKLVLQVGYMKRFDSGSLQFRELLSSKKLSNQKGSISVIMECLTGDSYVRPFGDFKSINKSKKFQDQQKEIPKFIPKKLSDAYEQYLNTFSHTLDLLNFFGFSPLQVMAANLNNNGHGITLLQSENCSIAFLARKIEVGPWKEKIRIIFPDSIYQIDLPAAFARSGVGVITISEGVYPHRNSQIITEPIWAFRSQALDFIMNVSNFNVEYLKLQEMVNVIEIVEKIFVKAFNLTEK